MKVLLFGKSGQLGRALASRLASLGDLVALDARSRDFCGDLCDLDGLVKTVKAVRPAVLVNAAAFTDVDQAEDQPGKAYLVNTSAPEVLASAAHDVGAWMVHYSSDYVFDGNSTRSWRETDPATPLNVYGQTKLAGEQAVARVCSQNLVFRTCWLYSSGHSNFATRILRVAQAGEPLKVVADQFGTPTPASLVADVTVGALRQIFQNAERPALEFAGLYHVAASGCVSWHEYACVLVELATRAGILRPDHGLIVEPTTAFAFSRKATRPGHSCLDTAKLRDAFNVELPEWRQALQAFVNEQRCE